MSESGNEEGYYAWIKSFYLTAGHGQTYITSTDHNEKRKEIQRLNSNDLRNSEQLTEDTRHGFSIYATYNSLRMRC